MHRVASFSLSRAAGFSAPRRHLEPGADVRRYLGCVVIDEMTDSMMRDAPQLGPVAQGGDGGFLVLGENPAAAQADDVRESVFCGGRELGIHTPGCRSTHAADFARRALRTDGVDRTSNGAACGIARFGTMLQ